LFEEGAFHVCAALVAAEAAVAADGAVAGDEEGERVAGEGVPDSAGTTRDAKVPRDALVGADISSGDSSFREEDSFLEGSAAAPVEEGQIKVDWISVQEPLDGFD
jgi:hypothetical protein